MDRFPFLQPCPSVPAACGVHPWRWRLVIPDCEIGMDQCGRLQFTTQQQGRRNHKTTYGRRPCPPVQIFRTAVWLQLTTVEEEVSWKLRSRRSRSIDRFPFPQAVPTAPARHLGSPHARVQCSAVQCIHGDGDHQLLAYYSRQ